jgi:hypothetical protein
MGVWNRLQKRPSTAACQRNEMILSWKFQFSAVLSYFIVYPRKSVVLKPLNTWYTFNVGELYRVHGKKPEDKYQDEGDELFEHLDDFWSHLATLVSLALYHVTQMELTHATVPNLLHSVPLIGSHPSFTRKGVCNWLVGLAVSVTGPETKWLTVAIWSLYRNEGIDYDLLGFDSMTQCGQKTTRGHNPEDHNVM